MTKASSVTGPGDPRKRVLPRHGGAVTDLVIVAFLWILHVSPLHGSWTNVYIINHIQRIPSKNLLKINNKQELGVLEHACL